METLALPNYSALGSTITPDMTRGEAMNAVSGYRWLGDGATANVYLAPCGTRVLKLVTDDAGNRATIDAALAHPDNPHLPRIYGFMGLACGGFAVEMERLENGRSVFGDWEGSWSPGRGEHVYDELPDYILEADDCPMKDALIALHEAALNYSDTIWDCHGGNLMVRPSTGELVLNDLIYGGSRKATCERCNGSFDHDEEGGFVEDELWCGFCHDEHAIFCEVAQEHVPASENDAKALDATIWEWRSGPWVAREGYIADANREIAADNGYVWDEDAELFVEAELHAVLSAIQGIARCCLEQHIEPRLPLRLAA